MNNAIDLKFNTIIECANRILSFQKELATSKTDSEREQLNFFIEEQKKLIEEYTDISIDDILPQVAVLNAMKKQIEVEKDSEKNKLRKEKLSDLTNNLKSEVCKKTSKENNFRNNQKVEIDSLVSVREDEQISKDIEDKQR